MIRQLTTSKLKAVILGFHLLSARQTACFTFGALQGASPSAALKKEIILDIWRASKVARSKIMYLAMTGGIRSGVHVILSPWKY